jgi:hydrogenase maturation factor HypF (carbamoyltransferase family)
MSNNGLKFKLHEYYGDVPDVIDDVDFGKLMMNLGSHNYSRQFSITFERTQEIELILVVGGILGTAYFKTLGTELAKWTVEELKRRVELRRVELKAGRKTINVGRRGRKKAIMEIEKLLKAAHKNGQEIEISMARKNKRRW